jgi:hypothetical protein
MQREQEQRHARKATEGELVSLDDFDASPVAAIVRHHTL